LIFACIHVNNALQVVCIGLGRNAFWIFEINDLGLLVLVS
jgi:hypothetical protein